MTPSAGLTRSRPATTLVVAGVTLAALVVTMSMWSSADAQSADPWEGSRFTSPTDRGSTADGSWSGVFKHTPPAPVAKVALEVRFAAGDAHPSACTPTYQLSHDYPTTPPTSTTSVNPSTTDTSTPSTTTPDSSSTTPFRFDVTFACNGVYDAAATATVEPGSTPAPLQHTIQVLGVTVAIPPLRPASLVATDNGDHTVTLSWTPAAAYSGKPGPPPDFLGYRLSRMDAGGSSFAVLGTTTPDVLTFTDSVSADGGSFVYEVEAVRRLAVSAPTVTAGALTISAPAASGGGGGGGGGGGRAGGQGSADGGDPASGTGTAHFDQSLAADEGQPGSGDLALPGAGAIQRFAGRQGAGLVKPFAAALDLAVWAGLLLFLTRRAASAARADVLPVELEHPT